MNVKNLILRPDIIDAVKDGNFKIYPVNHYEEALEILTDMEAGEELVDGSFAKNSLNDRLMNKLCKYAKMRRASNIRIPE